MLGGEITVSSVPGQGAQFELLLPRIAPANRTLDAGGGLAQAPGLGSTL